MTLLEAIAAAAARLNTSDTARLDAEILAAHAMGITREALLLRHLADPFPSAYEKLVARRAAGEPVAYIVGERDFWTITLMVAPGVLIPRPDSETLIEEAVRHFGAQGPETVLDLGTGSGALLLAALTEWPDAQGLGIDKSEAAVAIATRNATRLGIADRARIQTGDWAKHVDGRFDLILCNPPYIEKNAVLPRDVAGFEPSEALYAGADGLDDYRRLAPEAARLLAPGGIALFEIGAGQGAAVTALFEAAGQLPRLVRDLGGRDRCVAIDDIVT